MEFSPAALNKFVVSALFGCFSYAHNCYEVRFVSSKWAPTWDNPRRPFRETIHEAMQLLLSDDEKAINKNKQELTRVTLMMN